MSSFVREWRNIAKYPNYQVSNDGYVRSLPDIDHRGQFMPGYVLATTINEKGYEHVWVTNHEGRKKPNVARLRTSRGWIWEWIAT